MKMEQIQCSETLAYNNQTLGKYTKEYIQDSKQGESLKSRITVSTLNSMPCIASDFRSFTYMYAYFKYGFQIQTPIECHRLFTEICGAISRVAVKRNTVRERISVNQIFHGRSTVV